MRQAVSAGTPSTGARTGTLFQICSAHIESIWAAVNGYRSHLFQKDPVHYELEPFDLKNIVAISRLIQSQRKLIAASTRSAVDPDRGDLLRLEIVLELLCCIFRQLNHMRLLFMFCSSFYPFIMYRSPG